MGKSIWTLIQNLISVKSKQIFANNSSSVEKLSIKYFNATKHKRDVSRLLQKTSLAQHIGYR